MKKAARGWMMLGATLTLTTALLVAQAQTPVTITLSGPNQWTNSGTSFGEAWEDMTASFQKTNPNITFKTVVLPINSFFQTLATQLQAGSAPELIFNQTSYKSSQVVALNKYLNEPNPYAPEFKRWIDSFDPSGFNEAQQDGNGNWNWVPFNLVSVGLFVNEDAFTKAGVKLPLRTWEDWRAAAPKLKAAGYVAMGMDNFEVGITWTWQSIANQLMDKYFTRWNLYANNGERGTAKGLNGKSWTRAMKTTPNMAKLPEITASLQIMKELFENVTPNWSGIKPTTGAAVNIKDFLAGKSATTWAVNFAVSEIMDNKPNFKVGSSAFPTITRASTPVSTNTPARFGVGPGGTSYMIPATTTGEKLKAAVNFLQFVTSPKHNQPWLTASAGASAIKGVKAIPEINGFGSGEWGESARMQAATLASFSPQSQKEFIQIIQGYLLGSSNLEATQNALQASWARAADYQIAQNPDWKSESWAK
jgi:ABC-type glycerol-3-phosphate transport system substrate-binding protein